MVAVARNEGSKLGPNKVIQILRQRSSTESDSLSEHHTTINAVEPHDFLDLINANTPDE